VKQPTHRLKTYWYRVLKNSGFVDAENAAGQLIKKLPASPTQQATLDFYLALDSYLTKFDQNLKPVHKEVLRLYSNGEYIVTIAKKVNRSRQWVHRIIKEHKLNMQRVSL